MEIIGSIFFFIFLPYAISLLCGVDFLNDAIKNYSISFPSFLIGLIINLFGIILFYTVNGLLDKKKSKSDYLITYKRYYFEDFSTVLVSIMFIFEVIALIILRNEFNLNFWFVLYLITPIISTSIGLAGILTHVYIKLSYYIYKIKNPPKKILSYINSKRVVSFNELNKEFKTYNRGRWSQLIILGKYRRKGCVFGVSVGETERYYQSKSDFDALTIEIEEYLNHNGTRESAEIINDITGDSARRYFIHTACKKLQAKGFLDIIDIGANPKDSESGNRTIYSPKSHPMKSEEIYIE